MSSLNKKVGDKMDKILQMQQNLASILNRLVTSDGSHQTAIPSLYLLRMSDITEPLNTVYDPSLCIVAQGTKLVTLVDETYQYDPSSYLVASVQLPIIGQILNASNDKPYLGIQLFFNADLILSILNESNQLAHKKINCGRGVFVSKNKFSLLEAITRLLLLLDSPDDIPFLAPLIIKEIFYHVLKDEQGYKVSQFALMGTQSSSIAKVINVITRDFNKPLRIEALAKDVNMSTSSLHSHFKKVTGMGPMQYQKQIRLQEARHILLTENLDAADAAFKVGYESPSQFSREYTRMFGLPPKSDVKKLQTSLVQT